jgi:hypothetical protein
VGDRSASASGSRSSCWVRGSALSFQPLVNTVLLRDGAFHRRGRPQSPAARAGTLSCPVIVVAAAAPSLHPQKMPEPPMDARTADRLLRLKQRAERMMKAGAYASAADAYGSAAVLDPADSENLATTRATWRRSRPRWRPSASRDGCLVGDRGRQLVSAPAASSSEYEDKTSREGRDEGRDESVTPPP